jgi:hypothetical protein
MIFWMANDNPQITGKAPSVHQGWAPLFGITIAVGLVAGATISILAFLLARYGPSGDSWSFRGNGALAAYTLLSAVEAGGWTALALRARSSPRWLSVALAAGAVGMLLAIASATLLPAFGPGADRIAGPFLLLALVAWMGLAPVLAILTSGRDRSSSTATRKHLVAGAAWLVSTLGGLIVAGIVVPAGS